MALPSSIIQRGTRAAQPAATAVAAGTLYCVTDESDLVERSSGAAWQAFGGAGGGGGGLVITAVVKAADETVTSSDVLQDDNDLALAVAANAVYLVELVLWVATGVSNTPDIKTAWTLPTLATISTCLLTVELAAASTNDVSIGGRYQESSPSTPQASGVVSGVTTPLRLAGLLRTGANAGTLQLQWAQNTSNGTGTVVKADSYLSLTRVS